MEAAKPQRFVELGTHFGTSYFAFCQAAERLDLDCESWAVDTWQDDEHAGFYGEERVLSGISRRDTFTRGQELFY